MLTNHIICFLTNRRIENKLTNILFEKHSLKKIFANFSFCKNFFTLIKITKLIGQLIIYYPIGYILIYIIGLHILYFPICLNCS